MSKDSSGGFFNDMARAFLGDVAKAGARAVDAVAQTAQERLVKEAKSLARARRTIREQVEIDAKPVKKDDEGEIIDAEFVVEEPKPKK